MSQNSRIKNRKTDSFNFDHLEELIETSSAYLAEQEIRFSLQAKALNANVPTQLNIQLYLEKIQKHLNFLNILQSELDEQLRYVKMNLQRMEDIVANQELNLPPPIPLMIGCSCYKSDKNCYEISEDIHAFLLHADKFLNEFQDVTHKTTMVDTVAEIFEHHLQQLESVEMKMEKMKSQVNKIEYLRRKCFGLLKIAYMD